MVHFFCRLRAGGKGAAARTIHWVASTLEKFTNRVILKALRPEVAIAIGDGANRISPENMPLQA